MLLFNGGAVGRIWNEHGLSKMLSGLPSIGSKLGLKRLEPATKKIELGGAHVLTGGLSQEFIFGLNHLHSCIHTRSTLLTSTTKNDFQAGFE